MGRRSRTTHRQSAAGPIVLRFYEFWPTPQQKMAHAKARIERAISQALADAEKIELRLELPTMLDSEQQEVAWSGRGEEPLGERAGSPSSPPSSSDSSPTPSATEDSEPLPSGQAA